MSTPGIGRIAGWCRRSDWGTAASSLVFGCGIALALASCLEVPIGDPELSQVDSRLNGAWRTPVAGDVWFFRPWDARTWLVTDAYLHCIQEGCNDSAKDKDDQDFGDYDSSTARISEAYIHKGWLTTLGGREFLVLEPAAVIPPGEHRKGYRFSEFGWFVFRLDWVDEDHVQLRQLDPGFQGLGELHSRKQAERIIRAFVDDSALYAPTDDDADSPNIPIMSGRSVLSRTSEEVDGNIQQQLWIHMGYSK